jgi:predicted aspartyl protease
VPTFRLLVLIVTLAAHGCVAVGPAGGTAAPGPGEVRFDLAGPGGAALVVPVRINDAGPFPFVLDTGATVTCVDETLVAELKLPDATGTIAIGGGIRGLGRMRLVTLESVQLGDARVRDLNGCAVDLGPMRQAGLDIRGLLGLNFLRAYRLTVDFGAQIVRVEPTTGTPNAK